MPKKPHTPKPRTKQDLIDRLRKEMEDLKRRIRDLENPPYAPKPESPWWPRVPPCPIPPRPAPWDEQPRWPHRPRYPWESPDGPTLYCLVES